jgi:chromosome condensin MukBEF ATPase and DNA-binding subunit MukB
MSDPAPAPAPAPVDAILVPVPAPAPAPAPASAVAEVKAAVVDFANRSDLLKFVIQKIAEVDILADRSDEDKAKFIVDEVKKAIRESPLSDEQKTQLVTWCDIALPYVIEAVKIVKAELGKVANVALAEVKKCCPSWFSAKKPAQAPPA